MRCLVCLVGMIIIHRNEIFATYTVSVERTALEWSTRGCV